MHPFGRDDHFVMYEPESGRFGQNEDEQRQHPLDGRRIPEYFVYFVRIVPADLESDISPECSVDRVRQQRQKAYESTYEVIQPLVGKAERIEYDARSPHPDAHRDEHPDIEDQGVLRNALVRKILRHNLFLSLCRPPADACIGNPRQVMNKIGPQQINDWIQSEPLVAVSRKNL